MEDNCEKLKHLLVILKRRYGDEGGRKVKEVMEEVWPPSDNRLREELQTIQELTESLAVPTEITIEGEMNAIYNALEFSDEKLKYLYMIKLINVMERSITETWKWNSPIARRIKWGKTKFNDTMRTSRRVRELICLFGEGGTSIMGAKLSYETMKTMKDSEWKKYKQTLVDDVDAHYLGSILLARMSMTPTESDLLK
ncbi:hypothetical protein INT47_007875 [Mucor saturninus]|uniref:Uncharacterized protein n=1 Tax=Mucor saturninus TaxID=64648 RepID=A0A8H7QJ81_9FUNG|nr:hypothetical protein INT47_007875 [Mucor saturninus]